MGQLDHFDSGNTITPENDDTCEVSVVPPACPTCCLQLPPASPHTRAPFSCPRLGDVHFGLSPGVTDVFKISQSLIWFLEWTEFSVWGLLICTASWASGLGFVTGEGSSRKKLLEVVHDSAE